MKKAIKHLEKANRLLEQALDELNEASQVAKACGRDRIYNEIQGYTIGNISKFSSDDSDSRNQSGNIPELLDEINEYITNQDHLDREEKL